VQHINLSYFVELGSALSAVRSLGKQSHITLYDAWGPTNDLREKLSNLLAGRPLWLEVSVRPAKQLLDGVQSIHSRYYGGPDGDAALDLAKDWTKEIIPPWEFAILETSVDAFQHVLAAEFNGSATFYVPQRWGYHTATLILNASACAGLADHPQFQGIAKADFTEAGKCLAFLMPTAAGFHAARAVEAVLFDYYSAFLGRPTSRLMMGEALAALDKRQKDGPQPTPSKKTLRTLREIKDLDRNPLAHPQDTLDMTEAKALFDLAGIVIAAMLREIDGLGAVHVQLAEAPSQ
jgi:hypothetical protein